MGRRWTDADVAKLPPGMVKGQPSSAPAPATEKKKRIKKIAPELLEMKTWLRVLKVPYASEYIFHPVREWRFDIAIVESKIAIEYEGIFSEKSGHTSVGGYIKDCQKYNAAALLGWRVLRYTSNNYEEFMRDITELLNIQNV